jgi:hypothetical protein
MQLQYLYARRCSSTTAPSLLTLSRTEPSSPTPKPPRFRLTSRRNQPRTLLAASSRNIRSVATVESVFG